MTQQEQETNRVPEPIATQQVWPLLTKKQQQQFVETVEMICQRLASRFARQQEGDDALS